VNEANELTDSGFWDEAWAKRPVSVVSRYHYLFGKNGIFLRAYRGWVQDLEGKRIIELGGANSRYLLALSKWCGADVTAVDYSMVGLKKTEELFARNRCRVTLIQDDFLTWDYRGEPFDAVVHWGVLEHFRDPSPVLRKCSELVGPGGVVVFSMPNMGALGAYFWRKWSPGNWRKHVFHSDDVVRRACAAVGLKVTDVFYWGLPLLRISRWERNGLLQMLITGAQLATLALDYVLPLYHRGQARLSMHRGFIARKA